MWISEVQGALNRREEDGSAPAEVSVALVAAKKL